ncbi:MAG: UDP-3-O-(3-hydroxymyristoyl)glucosamine N-acyltransferase [Candidatus Schekmanbacteria bacterium]|nr:MAG: UDP-3-O-(3-hydroxymyristoyl)glucosamine N-acyltransferase [Candidatus Schekmanbacteria bacterium]
MKTVKEIADFLGGELKGSPNDKITNVSGIEDADEGDITFIAAKKFIEAAKKTSATAVITPVEIPECSASQIIVKNPYLSFARVVELFKGKKRAVIGIDSRASIGENVKLGKDVSIYPYAVIEDNVEIGDRVRIYPGVYIGSNSKIGEDSTIYSNTSIREETIIGNRVTIHSNTSIGGDGFGYVQEDGKHIKIPQVGNVIIEDDVEIGSNVCIDRATLGVTIIREGTKIDNHVQIAHNVEIGKNVILVSQVGISGSCKIGDNVMLAGQVGIADHVRIGDNTMVGAKSGIGRNIPANSMVSGAPAFDHRKWRRTQACLPKLPDLFKRIRELEKKISRLEKEK